MFHIGQKVVCITDFARIASKFGLSGPKEGNVYTIREFDDRGNGLAIRVEEIVNPRRHHHNVNLFVEPAFLATGFRPIVEKKTDISFAHEILRKVSRKKTERV